ncbi:MAG TPA: AAA family ATPase [Streptosporangiaceae bacterium]|nr:AAA family ATPase [Streptosporangiaceae bacterium]
MRHVIWIGGPPASGKTTVATRLACRHGLRLYSADTRTWVHRDRALAAGVAAAARWEAMTPAERWERSSVADMLEMSLHRQRGAMVIEDLAALPVSPPIVAEGSVLPPSAASRGIAVRSQAVWLIPTPRFQRQRLRARGTPPGPTRLYAALAALIRDEATRAGVQIITVDGSRDVAQIVAAVEEMLAAALVRGPRAGAAHERQALRSEANEAIAAQVHGYYARPWASGDPGAVVQLFICECGDATCCELVPMPVGALGSQRPAAPGHTCGDPGP